MRLKSDDILRIADAVRPPRDEPGDWLDRATHRKIIVNTKDGGTSIEGVLRETHRDGLLLWNAQVMSRNPVNLTGEVFIPKEQVLFVQTVDHVRT